MSLAALIRKCETGKLATAIPAISATPPDNPTGTVARVATIAVANPTEAEPAILSRHWLLHFHDREPVACTRSPPATWREMLADNPDAIAAEPYQGQGHDNSNPVTKTPPGTLKAPGSWGHGEPRQIASFKPFWD